MLDLCKYEIWKWVSGSGMKAFWRIFTFVLGSRNGVNGTD